MWLAPNAVKICSTPSPYLRVGDAIIHMQLEHFGKYNLYLIVIYKSVNNLATPLYSYYSYRAEMAIADDTAEGTFVWFDGVMTKFHSLRAREAVQMLVCYSSVHQRVIT